MCIILLYIVYYTPFMNVQQYKICNFNSVTLFMNAENGIFHKLILETFFNLLL